MRTSAKMNRITLSDGSMPVATSGSSEAWRISILAATPSTTYGAISHRSERTRTGRNWRTGSWSAKQNIEQYHS